MYIVLVIGSENAGGSENQMRLLARALIAAGHKVTVIFTDHPTCRFRCNPKAKLDFSGIDNIKLSMRRFFRLFYLPFGRFRLKRKKIDIAVACDPVNAHIASQLLVNSNTKLIFRISGLSFTLPGYAYEKTLLPAVISAADAIISNAEIALTTVRELEKIPPEKCQCVIRNTVICHEAPVKVQANKFHVIFVGRLESIKDPLTALKALEKAQKEISGLTGEFVGDGSLLPEMQDYINKHELADFIKISGFIPQKDIPYQSADLLVNSSISELSSGAIAEALYRGIPIVASNVGGNPELIGGHEFGSLFPAGNVDALAAAIVKFARKTPEERQNITLQARKYAEENFSPENYLKSYIDLFNKLLKNK